MRRSYRAAISATAVAGLLAGGGAAIAARPDAKVAPKKAASQPSQPPSTAELARLTAALAANKGNANQLRSQIAALQAAIAKAHQGTAGQQPAAVSGPKSSASTQSAPGRASSANPATTNPAPGNRTATSPADANSTSTDPTRHTPDGTTPAGSPTHSTPSPTHHSDSPSDEPSDPGGGGDD